MRVDPTFKKCESRASVSFNVRSPNGAQVQFGIGGCTTPFTSPISSTWTTVTLSLGTASLSCNPTLSDVHLLFEVLTNDVYDPRGATVLLDNIQFNPVPTMQAAALSFPRANQTFGVAPQLAPPIPSDQVLRNLTTIYESSLALYALLARGTPQDLQNAELIANAFDYALHHESHGDPIPAANGGYTGLHNGYENGDLGLYNNQPPPLLGQDGDIRLSGFTDTSLCSPSNYCVVLDGASGGNNAFAIIALVAAYRQFGNVNYLNDALTIGNWIKGNLTDTTGTGYGGYYVGYGDEGVPPPKPLETGKSIENNADIFAAFTALADIESQLGNGSAAASWTAAANVAGDFVMQMYDSAHGRFNVGTSPVGTPPSPGACPTGPVKGNDVINVCDFLDSNTFTTLALAGAPRYHNQIDWRLPIQYVLNTFAQTVTAAGHTYQGFNIVPTPDSGANGIAWEFTGQSVEAMNYVDALYNVTTLQSQANFYLDQIAQAQISAPFGDGLGLVASTLQDGDTLTPVNQCLSTPYQCIAERVGLAATTWGILAEKGLNYYATAAAMSSPTPGSTLSGASVTFTWTAGAGATAYWLDVGTVQGQGNISAGQLAYTVTSETVSGIPTTGGTIYVRLWTMLNGAWQYHDYMYTAANLGTLAVMSTPAPGSTLTGSSVTFTWTAGAGATAYWLDVGTVQGQGNISAGQLAYTVTSETVSGIPTTGGTIYVRLWTMLNGAWQYHDYTYTAANLGTLAALISPTPGSLLPGCVTFSWTPGSGATAYWLDVGTVQGQGNISAGQLASSVTHVTVCGIPTTGGTIYVRLWTMLNGTWQYHDYTYMAANLGTLSMMSTPAPGSTLTGSSVTFTWTAAVGASAYWLDVGTVQGQGNIAAGQLATSVTNETVSGIPTNGSTIYVRLWTQISGTWSYHDYTYTAF